MLPLWILSRSISWESTRDGWRKPGVKEEREEQNQEDFHWCLKLTRKNSSCAKAREKRGVGEGGGKEGEDEISMYSEKLATDRSGWGATTQTSDPLSLTTRKWWSLRPGGQVNQLTLCASHCVKLHQNTGASVVCVCTTRVGGLNRSVVQQSTFSSDNPFSSPPHPLTRSTNPTKPRKRPIPSFCRDRNKISWDAVSHIYIYFIYIFIIIQHCVEVRIFCHFSNSNALPF